MFSLAVDAGLGIYTDRENTGYGLTSRLKRAATSNLPLLLSIVITGSRIAKVLEAPLGVILSKSCRSKNWTGGFMLRTCSM